MRSPLRTTGQPGDAPPGAEAEPVPAPRLWPSAQAPSRRRPPHPGPKPSSASPRTPAASAASASRASAEPFDVAVALHCPMDLHFPMELHVSSACAALDARYAEHTANLGDRDLDAADALRVA